VFALNRCRVPFAILSTDKPKMLSALAGFPGIPANSTPRYLSKSIGERSAAFHKPTATLACPGA
jgi:hypothetical protein